MSVIILENPQKENWNMQNNTGKQSDSLNPTPSSVPLPHDELLTDEEKINITNDVCKKNNTSWDEVWELPKLKTELIAIKCYEAVAKAQQKKCHQSESAEIAELRALFFKANEKIAELDEQLSEAKAEARKEIFAFLEDVLTNDKFTGHRYSTLMNWVIEQKENPKAGKQQEERK